MIDNRSTTPQSILIDFGKGCFAADGKSYNLSPEERCRYALEHPQVAPDLRDGHCRQTPYSDVYSLGRVIKQVNDKFLTSYASLCNQYNCTKRSSSDDLFTFMQRMLMST